MARRPITKEQGGQAEKFKKLVKFVPSKVGFKFRPNTSLELMDSLNIGTGLVRQRRMDQDTKKPK
jgi:hypothetical protein